MSGEVKGVHHIGIVVRDAASVAAWFTEAFGLSNDGVLDLGPNMGKVTFVDAGNVLIELVEYHDTERREHALGSQSAVLEHICFHVDDAEAAHSDLSAKGIGFRSRPRFVHDRIAFFSDPATTGDILYQFRQPGEPGA